MILGGRIPPGTELLQAQNYAGQAMLGIEGDDRDRQLLGPAQVAGRKGQDEGALDQHRIVGVVAQGLGEILGGEVVVADLAGVTAGEITAGKRGGVDRSRTLRGGCRSGQQQENCGQAVFQA